MAQVYFQDEDSQKEFFTLQSRLVETSKQLSLASTTLSLKQQERRRTELTLKELDPITDDVKTFKGVGRMFVFVPQNKLKEEMKQSMKENDSDLEALKKHVDSLEKTKKETESTLQELVIKNTRNLSVS